MQAALLVVGRGVPATNVYPRVVQPALTSMLPAWLGQEHAYLDMPWSPPANAAIPPVQIAMAPIFITASNVVATTYLDKCV